MDITFHGAKSLGCGQVVVAVLFWSVGKLSSSFQSKFLLHKAIISHRHELLKNQIRYETLGIWMLNVPSNGIHEKKVVVE